MAVGVAYSSTVTLVTIRSRLLCPASTFALRRQGSSINWETVTLMYDSLQR